MLTPAVDAFLFFVPFGALLSIGLAVVRTLMPLSPCPCCCLTQSLAAGSNYLGLPAVPLDRGLLLWRSCPAFFRSVCSNIFPIGLFLDLFAGPVSSPVTSFFFVLAPELVVLVL